MAKRPTLVDITAGFGSNTQHNANNDAIEVAFDNTLSRDGSTPNAMEADFDLNSNDLLNGGTLNADDIVIGGTSLQAKVDEAAASATAAASSASAAATSASNAAASFDSFDDRYLGSKTSDPTLDNDGNALLEGALYWNSTANELRVYNGSAWVAISGGVTTFLGLSDTPSSYTGQSLKVARVNAGETAIEFVALAGSEPSDGDKGDITVSGGGLTWTIDSGVVTPAKLANADFGDFTVAAGVATIDNSAITTAKIADANITTIKIADDNVTYGKIQNVTATNRFLGRITAGAGNIEELTGTQATTLLDTFTSALKGVAPASGGGTTNFLRADGTWADPGTGVLTFDVVKSGVAASHTFTGIPSTAKEIFILFDQLSMNNPDILLVQLGDAGGIETTGYVSRSVNISGASTITHEGFANGFGIRSTSSANSVSGILSLINITGNIWVASFSIGGAISSGETVFGGGRKETSAALTQVRLTPQGSSSFDSGQANLAYR